MRSILVGLIAVLLGVSGAASDGQPVMEHEIGGSAFAFHGTAGTKIMSFASSAEAKDTVQELLNGMGLPLRFEIRAADVPNALAVLEKTGQRLILYNPAFMEGLRKKTGDEQWPPMFVMAHEIGHHLAYHMDLNVPNHKSELEADYFAGFVLSKKGATLASTESAIRAIGLPAASATHPGLSDRLQAIDAGWRQASGNKPPEPLRTATAVPQQAAIGASTGDRRFALLIGNSAYRAFSQLANPANDIRAVSRALRDVGFSQITVLYDANAEQIKTALATFADDAKVADWAVVYFAGQGHEIDGTNYIVPIDATYETLRGLTVDPAFAAVSQARKLRLVIVDACRDNPLVPSDATATAQNGKLPGLAAASAGGRAHALAVLPPPEGIVVAYSTGPGQYAMDGAGSLSPFATSLIKHIRAPGAEIDFVFRQVAAEVKQESGGSQIPQVLGTWPAERLPLSQTSK